MPRALSWRHLASGVFCAFWAALGGCADSSPSSVALETQKMREQLEQLARQTSLLEEKLRSLQQPQERFVQAGMPTNSTTLNGQSIVIDAAAGRLGAAKNVTGVQSTIPSNSNRGKEKWVTRIPTHWNDGAPISPDKLAAIMRRIADEFGGASLDGPGRGIWIGHDGVMYEETSYTLSVACDASELARARELVNWIGNELKQQSMYFEVQAAPVQVIPVEN